ncbi:MAG: PQQ-binding-like beta-propeller repeat protein [Fuerstiella sp.]|jgi:outer membrane protein assembly factor BamB|nr:PQQ-binding-like beta-propeller repeat protein [Fuerstiella sp.]MDG2127116.1 PQQ-binding-like beta-propeller repeat protein [Fuerstiella sp.]
MNRIIACTAGLLIIASHAVSMPSVTAADWPTWRSDSRRSATTSEQLTEHLHPQWTLELPGLKPAWPEDPRLHFDANYEPVIAGSTLYYGSSRSDSVTAVDLVTGENRWRFFTDGPVRFAPLLSEGNVYFGADDGSLYCLTADSGNLVWRFRAAPNDRHVIGNERLISVWPVRGGPVLVDGQIQFTAGVWPFEGTFLYAVDAATGELVDSKPAAKSPRHDVVTLNDMTPQGYLAANDDRVFIPQGRSVVGSRNRKSGEFEKFQYSTSAVTNYHVATTGQWLFHGTVTFDTQGKRQLGMSLRTPVLGEDMIYAGSNGTVVAYDLTDPQETERTDRRGKKTKVTVLTRTWSLPNDQILELPETDYDTWLATNPLLVDIKAGERVYGHQGKTVFAIDLPSADTPAAVSWTTEVSGTPASMVVANGYLVVVTENGHLHCFGADAVEPRHRKEESQLIKKSPDWSERVAGLLKHADPGDSYCVAMGIGSGGLISELVRQSELRIFVIDPDSQRVQQLRQQYDEAGLYGMRIVAHAGDPATFNLPPYMASVVVSEEPQRYGFTDRPESLHTLFACLRPYGGTAYLSGDDDQHASFAKLVTDTKLARAEVARSGDYSLLTRSGALPGSANWTHEYGDESNTLMSHDQLVKAPLGVLWFGGPASDGSLFYNRHFWGPSMAVIGGRMFIQGPGKMTAVDVYTGRILWQIPLKDDDDYRAGRRGNDFEKHLSGFHFLVVEDSIYLVHEKSCLRLDPATGKQLAEFRLPDPADDWGRIRVKDDLLIAVVFRTLDADKEKLPDARKLLAGQRSPVEIVALNRHDGKRIWSHTAEASFPVISVGTDKIFCFDGALESFYQDWKRRGLIPKASDIRHLKAIDLQTGKEVWKEYTDIIGTWVSYSAEHDVLLLTNKKHVMAYRGQTGKLLWKQYAEGQGFKGHPESYWDRVIIWNDRVLDQRGPGLSWDLETGDAVPRLHPLTDEEVDWQFTKAGHHCNYAIASPHLMTFRAASAGFCDIESGETSRLNGFRSGCRNSLIPANGVLNAPNFAHGCVCGYSLFTSLSLVHLPESEVWSYSALSLDPKQDRIRRVGINLAAPGDRMADNGTMWFDAPSVGGSSPSIPVDVKGDQLRKFRLHSSLVSGAGKPWVAGSGVEGLTSLTVGLGKSGSNSKRYTVRLHFSEPDPVSVGERVFNVSVQGNTVIEQLDVAKESGGRNRAIVREVRGIEADSRVRIDLEPVRGRAILCGVEIVENDSEKNR